MLYLTYWYSETKGRRVFNYQPCKICGDRTHLFDLADGMCIPCRTLHYPPLQYDCTDGAPKMKLEDLAPADLGDVRNGNPILKISA